MPYGMPVDIADHLHRFQRIIHEGASVAEAFGLGVWEKDCVITTTSAVAGGIIGGIATAGSPLGVITGGLVGGTVGIRIVSIKHSLHSRRGNNV